LCFFPPSFIFCFMDLPLRLDSLQKRIEAACHRVGRDPKEVMLLPITKGVSAEVIRAAAELGLTVFGENKVQEARVKISLCPSRYRWHMVGHLQSNKCRDAVHFFEMIQSVDSLPLAQEINKWAEKAGKDMPVLLEVNVAGESSKFGYAPEQLLAELETLNALRRIEIHGLMTIAPWTAEPEKARPVFRRLRELKGECEKILGAPLQHLSMGMTGDFEIAVEEGATMLRIGTGLFGPRVPLKNALRSQGETETVG
jgi:pyridoxal phosphate enzyme (YggS family)